MAERKGPEGERPGQEPIDSGLQQDRSRGAGERDDEPQGTGDTGDDDGAAAQAVTSEDDTRPTGGHDEGDSAAESPDNVLSFRRPDRADDGTTESDGIEARADTADTEHFAGAESDSAEGTAQDETAQVETGQPAAAQSDHAVIDDAVIDDADQDPALLSEDELAEPVDLTMLRADDALLDALGGTDPEIPERAGSGPNLEELLVAWRRDIDAAPAEDIVDVDQAVAELERTKKSERRGWFRRRHLVPVATAAAVLMIGCTGVGVAARDALPGDMLWNVAEVLYTDHTQAVQAATSVREDLRTAESALDNGRTSTAESALLSAKERMSGVDDEHGLTDLRESHRSLAARIDEGAPEESPATPPTTTTQQPPSSETAPPTTRPDRPVPPTSGGSTTAPPTSTDGSTTPPTSSSETSGTSESSTSDPPWDTHDPLFSRSSEDQPSS